MTRTAQEKIDAIHHHLQRRQEALRLREEDKLTVEEVGRKLGVSKQAASVMIRLAKAERDAA